VNVCCDWPHIVSRTVNDTVKYLRLLTYCRYSSVECESSAVLCVCLSCAAPCGAVPGRATWTIHIQLLLIYSFVYSESETLCIVCFAWPWGPGGRGVPYYSTSYVYETGHTLDGTVSYGSEVETGRTFDGHAVRRCDRACRREQRGARLCERDDHGAL
jgi:hypothetical protein